MFFANDAHGKKVYIDDSVPTQSYFCPACGNKMILRRGNIVAHHFAHRAKKECDPWYTKKMSLWHSKMQSHFDKSVREIVIWDNTHTVYHIADIAIRTDKEQFIIEFQHSPISQEEFISRSKFYLDNGYTLIWVFDFCDCVPQKTIFVSDYKNGIIHLVWPGRDRVKFLDNINFTDVSDYLHIFFNINSGMGKRIAHNSEQYGYWETWEYVNPFSKHACFARLFLNEFERVDKFVAEYYSEEDFFHILNSLGE